MSAIRIVFLLILGIAVSCSGGSSQGGSFQMIEFLEAGQSEIARNAILEFRFSEAVAPTQDFSERLRIQNVQAGPTGSDMTKAIGAYLISGETVTFVPRLPEFNDRSDAGFRSQGNYHVFLKAGPDSLRSESGDFIGQQQEYTFDTSEFFEDPIPTDPPRAISLYAVDSTPTGGTHDISRAHPNPAVLALMTNSELLAEGKVIDPGAGSDYRTFWNFRLQVSEPLDPLTVDVKNIEMWELQSDVFESPPSTIGGNAGDVLVPPYRVPISTAIEQRYTEADGISITIRVTPLATLIDNARYRLVFGGRILGIDYRAAFIGVNGLTGDGETTIQTPTGDAVYTEIGGLGYTTEFLVYDRPGINGDRTVKYTPLEDSIFPEYGQTLEDPEDEARFNSALYDNPEFPGVAAGAVPAFGDGRDGDMSVTGAGITYLETGDELNEALGNPFTVIDKDPDDVYASTDSNMPTPGTRTYDSYKPSEWNLVNLTIGSSATLRIRGVNPALLRVQGLVTVIGTLDAGGYDGQDGSSGPAVKTGGVAGAGGFAGGDAMAGNKTCNISSCCSAASFDRYLNSCAAAKSNYPFSKNGQGPGRGFAGGEIYQYYYYSATQLSDPRVSGTGGGGGGHAHEGDYGEDLRNANGAYGTAGPAYDSTYYHKTSGLIGVRGAGGSPYGDTEVLDILVGGSGGGAGGALHQQTYATSAGSGGAGGGGGGCLEIYAAGDITLPGGTITVRGGNGGKGALVNTYAFGNIPYHPTGAGGGGSGGTVSLISGGDINVAGGIIDARGGTGGIAAHIGTSISCTACNAGGDGSPGLVLLMDQDGVIDGMLNNTVGEYDLPTGYTTIRRFVANRFGSIQACTELFHVGSADPRYMDIQSGDVFAALANQGQAIDLYASSAKASLNDPLSPDPSTETAPVFVAELRHASNGGVEVTPIAGAMAALNPPGDPARRAFIRIIGYFEYDDDHQLEAATGPYAELQEVAVRFRFNE